MDIKGITVRKVLVAAAADIVKEFYLGAILDRASRRIVVMGSAEGGVEIEEVARVNPAAIHRVARPPAPRPARLAGAPAGLRARARRRTSATFVAIARGLVATMVADDADLVEVNPLAIVRRT